MVFNGTAKMAYFDENLNDNGVNMNVKVIQDYPNVIHSREIETLHLFNGNTLGSV